jgi:hypothetical protein
MSFYINDLNQREVTSRQIAEQLVSIIERNYMRRANNQVRLDYYYDRQMIHLNNALNKQFRFPTRLNLQKEIVNITKMIVDELAGLYIEEPQRELVDGTDKDKELFQRITEEAQLNSVMDTNNKLVKLCKTTLVRPVWRDGEGIRYVIYTPNMFDVLENPQDPTKPLAIIYANNYDQEQYRTINDMHFEETKRQNQFTGINVVYHVWTATKYFTFGIELDKKNMPQIVIHNNPENEANENPYGTLDIFVPFRDDYAYDGFFCDGGDDLVITNELINVKKTELNYLTKMQSFGIPVRKGAGDTKTVFIADPSMTVDLPADTEISKGADFKFESPDPKIAELTDDINFKLRTLAMKYKLNPEMFSSSGERSSAESIQLQNFYLSKAIKRDKPRYALAETRLFKATKIVNNLHNTEQFSDSCYFKINYSDIETPTSITEKDQHNLLLYTNGIQSKAQWLLKTDPDLGSIEDAREKIKEIEAENGTTQQQPDTVYGQ